VTARRPPLPRLSPEQAKALIFVAAFRRKHGQGPTWAELRQAVGWDYREAQVKIRELYDHGLRWRTGVPRSLEVTGWGLARALKALEVMRKEAQA
jgi:hypothetical protein